jgi:hypothetical protein
VQASPHYPGGVARSLRARAPLSAGQAGGQDADTIDAVRAFASDQASEKRCGIF